MRGFRMSIAETFEREYRPLVDSFVSKLSTRPATDYAGIPHIFLPAWGKNYHHALIRIAVVGKETRGWNPNLDQFIVDYQKEKYDFENDREEFQNCDFTDASWMGGRPTRASFWGFWMNVLAKTYGVNDWEEIKRGKYNILLDSFLWGNVNAIETYTSAGVNAGAPGYWFAKEESKVFDSIELVKKVFDPHVIILTCAFGEMQRYLGDGFELLETRDDRVTVYQKNNLLVFHAPHPHNQMFQPGGADVYAEIMRDLLVQYKMFCPLPDVLQQGLSPAAIDILTRECSVDKMDKFEAIARIALELRRQKALMTARSLCLDVLYKAGHQNNRGTRYTGNCQGPCRLCATAYRRFENSEPETAEAIAYAFTNDNGFYAYE